MTVRNVKKQLLGMQDILQGVGITSQDRNNQAYPIARVDIPYAVNSEAEMIALDTAAYTRARVYTTTTLFKDYIFDSTAVSGVASDTGTVEGVGHWVTTVSAQSSQSALCFNSLADAQIGLLPSGDTVTLAIGNLITLKERTAGNQGGATWLAIAIADATVNGTDVIGVTTTFSLQLVLEDAMNTKQFGATHDGLVNDSDFLERAKASAQANKFILYMSTGFAMIDDSYTFEISGNLHIIFLAGSSIRMIDNAVSVYRMVNITGSNNIVENLSLIGDKVGHSGAASDTCEGLRISGSCILINPDVTSCWGDNVVIPYAGEVKISNLKSYFCGGDALVVQDVEDVLSLSGTTYLELSDKHGLSIEPRNNIEGLNNLAIESLVTKDCGESGVRLDFSAWQGAGSSYTTAIYIGQHKDYGSKTSFNVAPLLLSATENMLGTVYVGSAVYEQSGYQGLYIDNYSAVNSPEIHFGSLNIINANRLDSTNELEQTAIGMNCSVLSTAVGNLRVDHLRVVDNRGTQRCRTVLYADDVTFPNVGFKQVDITLDYFSLTDTLPVEIDSNVEGITIRDPYKLLDGSGFANLFSGESIVSFVSSGASALAISTSGANHFNGNLDVEFTVDDAAGSIRITPGVAETLLPLSTVAGKYIESTVEGSYLKLRRLNATALYVVAQIGTWTVEP